MKISMIAICRKDKIYKNNTAPIHIRFTLNRQIRYVSTGFAIDPADWDFEAQRVKTPILHLKDVQHQIDSAMLEYERKIRRLEALDVEITFETLLDTNSRKTPNQTVSEYFGKLICEFRRTGKLNTASKYRFCLSSLGKFHPQNITFDKIDKQFLAEFEQYLRDGGLSDNSVATKFASLKSAYNKALEDGIFVPRDNPFAKYKVSKLWTKTRKRAVSKEDILKLKAMELPEDGNSFSLAFARDIFLFSYYTAGINFKDIATLRHSDVVNGRVSYQRHKTKKLITCPLLPDAQHIIEKHCCPFYDDGDYIFPILDRQAHVTEQQIFNRVHKVLGHVNANLKTLSEMIGLKTSLTTYVARHTFATVLKRSGVNIAIISESLGHSDLATTQIYLDSFENTALDEAMRNLL